MKFIKQFNDRKFIFIYIKYMKRLYYFIIIKIPKCVTWCFCPCRMFIFYSLFPPNRICVSNNILKYSRLKLSNIKLLIYFCFNWRHYSHTVTNFRIYRQVKVVIWVKIFIQVKVFILLSSVCLELCSQNLEF